MVLLSRLLVKLNNSKVRYFRSRNFSCSLHIAFLLQILEILICLCLRVLFFLKEAVLIRKTRHIQLLLYICLDILQQIKVILANFLFFIFNFFINETFSSSYPSFRISYILLKRLTLILLLLISLRIEIFKGSLSIRHSYFYLGLFLVFYMIIFFIIFRLWNHTLDWHLRIIFIVLIWEKIQRVIILFEITIWLILC